MNVNYIKGFSPEQTNEMCNTLGHVMGLEFDMRSTGFLTDHFGGNPYLIRQACSHLHQSIAYVNRPCKITYGMVESASQQIENSASTYASGMLEVLKDFYPNEFELLCWLSAGKSEEFLDYIKNDPNSIAHLQGYGVIEEDMGNFYFRVKIFAAAMRQFINRRPDLFSQDAKREFISKQRNKIEQMLRQITRNIILSKYGRANAKAGILSMLTKNRQDHLSKSTLNDLFSDGESKLYITDFFGIVTGLQIELENLTGIPASDIKKLIATINDNRFDAHANSISDKSFLEFRAACTSILSGLELD